MKISKYLVFFFLVPSLYILFFPGKIVLITILTCYPLLFVIIPSVLKMNKKYIDGKQYINLYIFYSLIIFYRGTIDADSYQDWSTLLSTGVATWILLPFLIYYVAKIKIIYNIFSTFIGYGLILSILILTKGKIGIMDFAHTASPVYLLIIFIPYLNNRLRILIIILACVSFFSDLTVRANMLNILFAICVALTFRFRKKKKMLTTIKLIRIFLISVPIAFFILAITNLFNIFSIGKVFGEVVIETGGNVNQDLMVDSRSSIYVDVLTQLKKENAYLFGLGGSGKTETSLTDSANASFAEIYNEGRRGTESGMLNYAQWGGLIGVIIYFLLFVKASYLGVYKSNNWLCIMIGLWVSFKLLFSFIEDRLFLNIYSLFIFVPLGISFNKKLRIMNDNELVELIRGRLKKNISAL